MGAAAKNLDFRQRYDRRLVAKTITPERQATTCRRRMKNGE
jgi:hypothetical protein